MKIGLSMYSFDGYFHQRKIDITKFINYAGKLKIEGVELGDYYWRDKANETEKIPQLLRENNLVLAAYNVDNDFARPDKKDRDKELDRVKWGIEMALKLNTEIVSLYSGNFKKDLSAKDVINWSIEGLAESADYAGKCGIYLGLENHSYFCGRSEVVKQIIESVNSPYLRATIDIGNFVGVNENPVEGIRNLAPFVCHAHLKDFKQADKNYKWTYDALDGERFIGCIAGEGVVDLYHSFIELKKANYTGFLSLEFEGVEDSFLGVEKSIRAAKKILERINSQSKQQ